MKLRWFAGSVVVVALCLAGSLAAGPIVYSGQLFHGIPVTGTIYQPNGNPQNPVGAVYYYFTANSGASVEVFGDRLDGAYDMSFWVLSGLFSDTDEFGGSLGGHPYSIAFGDDQDPPNIPGPWGDPHVWFTAPLTGPYTVAVTNYLSGGSPPYNFSLQANGVYVIPEPSTLTLLGLAGIAGAAFRLRRKSR